MKRIYERGKELRQNTNRGDGGKREEESGEERG